MKFGPVTWHQVWGSKCRIALLNFKGFSKEASKERRKEMRRKQAKGCMEEEKQAGEEARKRGGRQARITGRRQALQRGRIQAKSKSRKQARKKGRRQAERASRRKARRVGRRSGRRRVRIQSRRQFKSESNFWNHNSNGENKKSEFLDSLGSLWNAKPACYWRFTVQMEKMKKLNFSDSTWGHFWTCSQWTPLCALSWNQVKSFLFVILLLILLLFVLFPVLWWCCPGKFGYQDPSPQASFERVLERNVEKQKPNYKISA